MTNKPQPMVYAALLALSLMSCSGEAKKEAGSASTGEIKALPQIEVTSLKDGDLIKEGDAIKLAYTLPQEASASDSIVVTFNDKTIEHGGQALVSIPTIGLKMGHQRIVIESYKNGKIAAERYLSVNVKSASAPASYTYTVVKTYPHDTHAYTQGLLFDGNTLYEGTGQKGISDLRIVDLTSGRVVKSTPLPNEIFGEGVTILGDKIYQLSWQEQRGFIYDRKKLEKLGEFTYAGEGWGLTTDGTLLLLSDGTNAIRRFDPKTLTEVSRIEVYDNTGAVDKLNELEYIDGEIWANVYMTDRVVRIDPETGKVLGSINFSNLLPKADYTEGTDVLNGIAYHKATGKIYVTGKNWPKLFEIKVRR